MHWQFSQLIKQISHNLIKKHLKLLEIIMENTKMIEKPNITLKPPPEVYGMKILDREKFNKTIKIPCLIMKNNNLTNVLKVVKKYLLKLEKHKPIINEKTGKTIQLNPIKIRNWQSFDETEQKALIEENLNENNLEIQEFQLEYKHYSCEDIFRAVLPTDQEGLSSFTRIGHIVHVNLREHLLPYKSIIGPILLDKTANCRTVINKTNNISNTYRNFHLEILDGDPDLITTVRENGCQFKLDFGQVYWNSRLCTEHERIIKFIPENSVLFDVFCGVGPFAVPTAKKKGCQVFANDLNPEAIKWLEFNRDFNKISPNSLEIFSEDAQVFIRDKIREKLPIFWGKKPIFITMNLPGLAIDFLQYFQGLYDENQLENAGNTKAIIYLYCFTKGENSMELFQKMLKEKCPEFESKVVDVFKVRTVSSMKDMLRITLNLDEDILLKKTKRKLSDCEDNFIQKKYKDGEKAEEN